MTTPDPRVEAYRAAAAKLGEALAIDDTRPYAAFERGDLLMDLYLRVPEGPARVGLKLLPVDTWTLGAAQLRLLVEAAMLEQEDRPDQPRCTAWRVALEYQAELGSLVRQWREEVTGT